MDFLRRSPLLMAMRNSSYGTTHFCMFNRQVQQEARIRSGSLIMALSDKD
jgi:hypothetical protein